MTFAPLAAFVWERVEKTETCWLWRGETSRKGYGRVAVGRQSKGSRRRFTAHRLLYEALVGPIPDGLTLDHLCRNRICVRPEHLEPVTAAVNNLRGYSPTAINAAKTHCIRGHEFNPANTGIGNKPGHRYCKACKRMTDAVRVRRGAKLAPHGGN
jgi:hypothetical protein